MRTNTNGPLFFLTTAIMMLSLVYLSCASHSMTTSGKLNWSDSATVPVFQADPSIYYENGIYYLYGTNGRNADSGFRAYTSNDLDHWSSREYVLIKGEAFGKHGFWAPQVWKYLDNYYMAYTANEQIAIAKSRNPLGPFLQDRKEPLIAAFKQIDPFLFIDDDGRKYLFHVRLDHGNHIYSAEMNDELSEVLPGTYRHCITSEPNTWEQVESGSVPIAEGPAVVKIQGTYYLFYSANDFRNKDYAVGYATSSSIYGPWIKYSGNPIISRKSIGYSGSGHGDIIKGKNEELYYVFHTHNSDAAVSPRKTAIVHLRWRKAKKGEGRFEVDRESFRYLRSTK